MTYSKPEVAVLGNASQVIQGAKNIDPESSNPDVLTPFPFELED